MTSTLTQYAVTIGSAISQQMIHVDMNFDRIEVELFDIDPVLELCWYLLFLPT